MRIRLTRARAFRMPAGFGVALTLLLLQACSPDKAPDACKLIDLTQAGQILGAKVTVSPVDTGTSTKKVSMCNYGDGTVQGSFMLLAAPMHPANIAKEVASEKKNVLDSSAAAGASLPQPKIQDVTGLGDAAFLVTSDAYVQLHVLGHGVKLVLTQVVGPSAAVIAKLEKLARLALAKVG